MVLEILIMDKELDLTKIIQKRFNRCDETNCDICNNTNSAIELMNKKKYDIIILEYLDKKENEKIIEKINKGTKIYFMGLHDSVKTLANTKYINKNITSEIISYIISKEQYNAKEQYN